MNIKISKEEHTFLQEYVLAQILMGSKLYGVDTEKSDTDYLCIYSTPIEWAGNKFNAFPNIHQFQYTDTENNIDYVYTSEDQSYWNLFSGDSTINADICLFSDKATVLSEVKLYILRTYKIIKAYLGFAKRDLSKGAKIDSMCHGARSLYIASCLIYNELPVLSEIQNIYNSVNDASKNKTLATMLADLKKEERENRSLLQVEFDCNDIFLYPDFTKHSKLLPNSVESIDSLLFKLLNSNNTKEFKY